MSTLEHDASELIASGMVTLNAKFVGVDDDKLVARVVEIWGFFWDQVLPYVEGVSIMNCRRIFGLIRFLRFFFPCKPALFFHPYTALLKDTEPLPLHVKQPKLRCLPCILINSQLTLM